MSERPRSVIHLLTRDIEQALDRPDIDFMKVGALAVQIAEYCQSQLQTTEQLRAKFISAKPVPVYEVHKEPGIFSVANRRKRSIDAALARRGEAKGGA